MKITVEKRREIFRSLCNAVFGEDLPGDAGIGPAGNLDRFEVVADGETFFKGEPQCALAGTATRQQSAINIEED